MSILMPTECCGVDEVAGLDNNPVDCLNRICHDKYTEDNLYGVDEQAFLLITDAVKNGNGRKLVAYIKKQGLGSVVGTRARKNPNSGNKIEAWLWSPNEKKLKRWFKAHNKKVIIKSYKY